MPSVGNDSKADHDYYMPHSLFVIHVTFSSLILFSGVLVNSVSIGVIVRLKLFRETSVLFTLHLMVVNLTTSIVAMSFALVHSFSSILRNDRFCRGTGFVVFVLIGTQMCNITLISVSTYLKVSHSTLGKAVFSRSRNVVLCLCFVWSIPFIIMLMPATEIWGKFSFSKLSPWCYPFSGGFGTFMVCFSLATSLSALLISYVGIVRTVLGSRRKVESVNQLERQRKKKLRNERQLIVAVVIMVTSFIILFLPSGVLPIVDPEYNLSVDIHIIFTYVMWSQNVLETVIYSTLNSKIRNGIRACIFCTTFARPAEKNVSMWRTNWIQRLPQRKLWFYCDCIILVTNPPLNIT